MTIYTVNVLINSEWTLITNTKYYSDALECVHRHNCGNMHHYQYQIIETTKTIIDHDEIMKTIDA